MRTLRAKLQLLCAEPRQAQRWNAELATEWIARQQSGEMYFYCDGHVRVYHGDQTELPRHYGAEAKASAGAVVHARHNRIIGSTPMRFQLLLRQWTLAKQTPCR